MGGEAPFFFEPRHFLFPKRKPPLAFAAHSFFQIPPAKNQNGGAARREGGTRGTPRVTGFSIGTQSGRTVRFQATTHAERAKWVRAECRIRSQVWRQDSIRGGFLWPRAKKATDFAARRAFPVCLRAKRLGTNSNALAFARVESEVRAEDFLEGGFFGGVVFGFRYFFKH